ncbi:MAG: EAL domain-containing protein [Gammaproteobacteria bacterium]
MKIDRSFVKNIGSGPDNVEIVRAVIATTQNLFPGFVAEGVENRHRIELLIHNGCYAFQDYNTSPNRCSLRISKNLSVLRKQITGLAPICRHQMNVAWKRSVEFRHEWLNYCNDTLIASVSGNNCQTGVTLSGKGLKRPSSIHSYSGL